MDLKLLREARDTARHIVESDIQTYVLKNRHKMQAEFLHLVADQWMAHNKARYKLPKWYANTEVIYPAPLSVEQSSSEITADYKAHIFADSKYPQLIDLTGGMGVDSSAFSKSHQQVIYVERNKVLSQIAKHNFEALGLDNIQVVNDAADSFLQKTPLDNHTHFYLDPARRDASKNKVFRIEDCEPDILSIRHLLANFMVKYSPMLDIKLAIRQLNPIAEVHVVAVENEVKELLFLNRNKTNSASITCVNFLNYGSTQTFSFNYESEQLAEVTFGSPLTYIYEPNAAILKAGAFRSIAQAFRLAKLAPNSHLYTSEKLEENFPGRSFICEAVCRFDKKEILSNLPGNQANVSTRNFPMKPDEVKKKLGLKDGGDIYLFATESYQQHKIVLICSKVKT